MFAKAIRVKSNTVIKGSDRWVTSVPIANIINPMCVVFFFSQLLCVRLECKTPISLTRAHYPQLLIWWLTLSQQQKWIVQDLMYTETQDQRSALSTVQLVAELLSSRPDTLYLYLDASPLVCNTWGSQYWYCKLLLQVLTTTRDALRKLPKWNILSPYLPL